MWAAYGIVYLKTEQIFSAVLELNFSEIVGIDRLGSSRDFEEFFSSQISKAITGIPSSHFKQWTAIYIPCYEQAGVALQETVETLYEK